MRTQTGLAAALILMALIGSPAGRADEITNSIDAAIMRQHRADVASGKIEAYRTPGSGAAATNTPATVATQPKSVAANSVLHSKSVGSARPSLPPKAVIPPRPVTTHRSGK